jgi:hypothetical protein
MRNVRFTVLGGADGSFEEHGTVSDLLSSVPYLLSARLVPPRHVVNDLLEKGGSDAGMSGGCTWDPFQITEQEWNDLVQDLHECEFVEPPEWVETIDDWNSWVMIFKYGYPEEFRDLEREHRELERAREGAASEGKADLAKELHARAIEVEERLAELAMKHRRRHDR